MYLAPEFRAMMFKNKFVHFDLIANKKPTFLWVS